jgi:integrase
VSSIDKRETPAGPRWDVRYRDPDGKQRKKTFKREGDAKKFGNAVETDIHRGQYTDERAGKVTFKEYAEEWLQRQDWNESTAQAVELRLRVHAFPGLGNLQLRAIKPETLQRWLKSLNGLAASYRRVIATNVSSVLADAVDNGKLSKNPFDTNSVRKSRPKVGTRKVVPWEAERVLAVREALPERWAVAVTLGAGLGLRQGEIFGLSPEDVDFLGGTVTVRRQVKLYADGSQVFALPKGGSGDKDTTRTVPLPSVVREALAAHLAKFPARDVSLPWELTDGKVRTLPLIFVSREGNALNRNYFNAHVWKKALVAAKVEATRDNGMHALRHFYASALLDGGESIKALSEYLGHTDPGFTLRTYTHLMASSTERTKKAVDAALTARAIRVPLSVVGEA